MERQLQSTLDPQTLNDGIQLVLQGRAQKVEVAPGIKIYECKDVIRVDLKIQTRGGGMHASGNPTTHADTSSVDRHSENPW